MPSVTRPPHVYTRLHTHTDTYEVIRENREAVDLKVKLKKEETLSWERKAFAAWGGVGVEGVE